MVQNFEIPLDLKNASYAFEYATDKKGQLYFVDEFLHTVYRFSRNGSALPSLGSFGSEQGFLYYPRGSVCAGDQFFVADSWNHRVQIFDLDGAYLGFFGEQGHGVGQFQVPTDIKIGPDGLLYVLDSKSQRLQIYDPLTKEPVALWDARGLLDLKTNSLSKPILGLQNPKSILINSGMFYVLEPSRIIQVSKNKVFDCSISMPNACLSFLWSDDYLVYCYDSVKKVVICYNMLKGAEQVAFSVSDNVKSVWVRDNRFMFLNDEILVVYEFENGGELGCLRGVSSDIVRPVLVGGNKCFSENSSVDLVPLTLDFPVTKSLFEKLECFLSLDGNRIFKSADVSILGQPISKPVPSKYLTDEGLSVVNEIESMLSEVMNSVGKCLDLFVDFLGKKNPDQRLAECIQFADRFFNWSRDFLSWRFNYVERANVHIEDPKFYLRVCQGVDAAIFCIDRSIRMIFPLVLKAKNVLKWGYKPGERIEQEAFRCIFLAPSDYASFLRHFFYFASLPLSSCGLVPDQPRIAFERAKWAIENTLFFEAKMRLVSSGESKEPYLSLHNSNQAYAEFLQLFRFGGRLQKSYGFPYNLHYYTLNSFWSGSDDGERFISQIKSLDIGSHPGIRYDIACFFVLGAKPEAGIDLLHETVKMLSDETMQSNAVDQLRNSLFSELAVSLASIGRRNQAIEVLPQINNDNDQALASVNAYLRLGDFDKVRDICSNFKSSSWKFYFIQCLSHVYQNNWELAMDLFSKPPSDFPTEMGLLCHAICARGARDFDKAWMMLHREEVQNTPLFFFQKGILLRMMDKDSEAMVAFEQQRNLLPFWGNQLQMIMTLRKLGDLPQSLCLQEHLPLAAFVTWNGVRISPGHLHWEEAIDSWLSFERHPVDESADNNTRLNYAWMLESEISQTMFFLLKDFKSSVVQSINIQNVDEV